MAREPDILQRRLDRERRARLEAEAIAERSTRDLYDRQQELRLLAQVAATANHAEALAMALPAALQAVGDHMRWSLGHAWTVDDEGFLRSAKLWHARGSDERFRPFLAASAEVRLAPGDGLVGGVAQSARPAWTAELRTALVPVRATAAVDAGLISALAFPVLVGDEVVAVLEFLAERRVSPDQRVVDVMAQVGIELGRVVERERAAAELREMNLRIAAHAAELERSNAELERFASAASHDLVEPLRTIGGFVQLLGKRYADALDDDGRQFISLAADGVERLQRMLDGLLAIARAGHGDLSRSAVDMEAVARRTVDDLQARIEDQQATIDIGPLPTVAGDATHLHRVLLNLVGNALKYTRPGVPPRIEVSAAEHDEGHRIVVRDNGPGIDPRELDRIFEPFRRGGNARQTSGEGIGLALCRAIVERHGGRLWAEHTDDGSTFVFTLPAAVGSATR